MAAEENKVWIESTLSTEAVPKAKKVIDNWRGATFLSAFVSSEDEALMIYATQDDEARLLAVVGCMNFGYRGDGPRSTVEILEHTKSFGDRVEIECQLYTPNKRSVIMLRAVDN